jgi:hypothetical protein
VVLATLGEGYITVRWQSHTLDVPVTQVRPHLIRSPTAALHNSGKPAIQQISDQPAIQLSSDQPADSEEQLALAMLVRDQWEQYWLLKLQTLLTLHSMRLSLVLL